MQSHTIYLWSTNDNLRKVLSHHSVGFKFYLNTNELSDQRLLIFALVPLTDSPHWNVICFCKQNVSTDSVSMMYRSISVVRYDTKIVRDKA